MARRSTAVEAGAKSSESGLRARAPAPAPAISPAPDSGDGRPRHAADPVFDELAAAIIDGVLPPGTSLPPERELAVRFGVSRLIVRQAVHRLADVGLVRVRQGGPSLVVHPKDAKDLRIIELVYRAGKDSPRDVRELIERQFMSGHALLFIAARRASQDRLREIAAMAADYAARGAPVAEMMAFEKRFFAALAEATDNRFYQLETSWWYRLIEERQGDRERPPLFSDAQRAEFYTEIARRLVEDRDAARYYLDSLSPILAMLGSLTFMAPR